MPVEPGSAAILRYGPHGSTVARLAALCPSCGVSLTPFRVTVELGGVQMLDAHEPIVADLVALVAQVVEARAQPPECRLRLRAQDVSGLAARNDTTRTHLALRLDELGVLAAVDIATKQVVSGRGNDASHPPVAGAVRSGG